MKRFTNVPHFGLLSIINHVFHNIVEEQPRCSDIILLYLSSFIYIKQIRNLFRKRPIRVVVQKQEIVLCDEQRVYVMLQRTELRWTREESGMKDESFK